MVYVRDCDEVVFRGAKSRPNKKAPLATGNTTEEKAVSRTQPDTDDGVPTGPRRVRQTRDGACTARICDGLSGRASVVPRGTGDEM